MFPAVPVSWGALNFRPRLRRIAAKNISIMLPALPGRLIRPVRALPTAVPPHPGPKGLLVLPARKALRRVRPDPAGLVARAELDARVDFRAPAARPAPVDRVAVLVALPVRVALVARPVVLAVPPARA